MMEGLATKSREDGVAVETKPTKIGGFSGVVGPEADNKEVNLDIMFHSRVKSWTISRLLFINLKYIGDNYLIRTGL